MTGWADRLSENGYVVLKGVFSDDEMECARQMAATLLADSSAVGALVAQRNATRRRRVCATCFASGRI